MTKKEANGRCLELAYELSKAVSKVSDIRNSLEFVSEQMGWDGMLICDFDEALAKLAAVVSGTTLWATEDMFSKREAERLREQADAIDENRGEGMDGADEQV